MLTTVLPSGRRTGGEHVTQGIVDALRAAGWDVAVVGYARPGAAPAEGEVEAGRRPIETVDAGARALLWMARALATGVPYSVAKYSSRGYLAAARAELDRGAELVIADHAQVVFALRALGPPAAPLVFVAHNVEADVYDEMAAAASGPRRHVHRREARLIRRCEAELTRAARRVWALTDDDARIFGPSAEVLVVASQLTPPEPPPEPVRDIALIGNWGWRPNALGLEWFAAEVVPRLPALASIEVAGAGAERLAGRYVGVSARGRVPDAAAFMSAARVVAVPAVAGSGVQVKTLDAIACGAPVVATPVATRGLVDLPASVTVAADAHGFAAALARRTDPDVRERRRVEALDWSRARRARFAAQVAALAAAAAS